MYFATKRKFKDGEKSQVCLDRCWKTFDKINLYVNNSQKLKGGKFSLSDKGYLQFNVQKPSYLMWKH